MDAPIQRRSSNKYSVTSKRLLEHTDTRLDFDWPSGGARQAAGLGGGAMSATLLLAITRSGLVLSASQGPGCPRSGPLRHHERQAEASQAHYTRAPSPVKRRSRAENSAGLVPSGDMKPLRGQVARKRKSHGPGQPARWLPGGDAAPFVGGDGEETLLAVDPPADAPLPLLSAGVLLPPGRSGSRPSPLSDHFPTIPRCRPANRLHFRADTKVSRGQAPVQGPLRWLPGRHGRAGGSAPIKQPFPSQPIRPGLPAFDTADPCGPRLLAVR